MSAHYVRWGWGSLLVCLQGAALTSIVSPAPSPLLIPPPRNDPCLAPCSAP